MRVIQAVRLGHQSLVGHKRRSISTVIIMSVLFGVLLGVVFVVQGLENTILNAANTATDGKYYLLFSTNLASCEFGVPAASAPTGTNESQDNLANEYQDSTESYLTKCPEQTWMSDIAAEVAQYHGRIVVDNSVAASDSLANFIQYDLDQVPSGNLPVLVNLSTTLSKLDLNIKGDKNYRTWQAVVKQVVPDLLGQTYYDAAYGRNLTIVGILPSGNLTEIGIGRRAGSASWNPLDIMLGMLRNGAPASLSSVVLDTPAQDINSDNALGLNIENYELRVAVFDEFDDIDSYLRAQGCMTLQQEFCQGGESTGASAAEPPSYTFAQVFASQVADVAYFETMQSILRVVELAVIVIAGIVMILTCVKMIGAETLTIRLYRSVGASIGDICLIYLSYLLEICLLAVGCALVIGILIALIASMMNGSALSIMLTAAYTSVYDAPIILMGWNLDILQICGAMILVAPVCLLLCLPKLNKM